MHYTFVNKTKKEYFDLGKYLFNLERFQIDEKLLNKYLFENKGNHFSIENEDFEEDGFNEIDGF